MRSASLLLFLALPIAQASIPENPDLSQCDNCDVFPDEFLAVNEADLIDLESLRPERQLDFLIGEWELIFPYVNEEQNQHYTVDQPVGFEIIDWFVKDKILQAFQEWPFTGKGKKPFRAKSDFRYIEKEDRWQMTWLTNSSTAIYSGGLESESVIALYEYHFTGGRRSLVTDGGHAVRYLFRNITKDRFLVEWYESDDGGKTFNILKWRLLYRKRKD